jgi:hypothetical protein
MRLFDLLAVGAALLIALAFLIRVWWRNVRRGLRSGPGCSGCPGCSGGQGGQGEPAPGEGTPRPMPLGDLRKKP